MGQRPHECNAVSDVEAVGLGSHCPLFGAVADQHEHAADSGQGADRVDESLVIHMPPRAKPQRAAPGRDARESARLAAGPRPRGRGKVAGRSRAAESGAGRRRDGGTASQPDRTGWSSRWRAPGDRPAARPAGTRIPAPAGEPRRCGRSPPPVGRPRPTRARIIVGLGTCRWRMSASTRARREPARGRRRAWRPRPVGRTASPQPPVPLDGRRTGLVVDAEDLHVKPSAAWRGPASGRATRCPEEPGIVLAQVANARHPTSANHPPPRAPPLLTRDVSASSSLVGSTGFALIYRQPRSAKRAVKAGQRGSSARVAKRRRRSGASIKRTRIRARASGSPGGQPSALTPSSNSSAAPPSRTATTARPQAIPSMITRPNGSGRVLAWTTTSKPRARWPGRPGVR